MNQASVYKLGQIYQATLSGETDRDGWRNAARIACAANIPPERIIWQVAGRSEGLNLIPHAHLPEFISTPDFRVSRSLVKEIMTALLHSDPDRFALSYRLLWRVQSEPKIHKNPADPDVRTLFLLAKSVRRDIHKMHAFVRFRKIGESFGREQFVAWFEPDHHITAAVAPFFRNRFAGMDWLIVTPDCSISWNGQKLSYGPGGSKTDVPQEDCVEDEWRTYYANIFNPARVKVQAMKSEMPMKYWRNLPEADLIPSLIEKSRARTVEMIERAPAECIKSPVSTVKQTVSLASPASLVELYDALEKHRDPPMQNFSNRLVRGEGPNRAALMLVGEQPGDQEDKLGRVFVGPAGQMLERAMNDADMERREAFLTNAVKRFKHIPQGKRRIHQTPSSAEIDYYRWWVEQEWRLVKPKVVVALGGSAAQSLLGKKVAISRYRGQLIELGVGKKLLITVHPSYLLRIPDKAGREIEYQKFVRDLRIAKAAC